MKFSDCIALKEAVFVVDERVRYFGFLDNRRGMVMSELRVNDETQRPENQLVRDLTFFKAAMSSWAIYFGRVNYSVVSHDTIKIIMIPIESGLAIITTESAFPLEKVELLASKLREVSALLVSKV